MKMMINIIVFLSLLFTGEGCFYADTADIKPTFKPSTITLPSGFSSTVFYENLGRARHLAVRSAIGSDSIKLPWSNCAKLPAQ